MVCPPGVPSSPLKDNTCDGHSKQLVVAEHVVLSHLHAAHTAFPAAAESPRFPAHQALLRSHQDSAEALVLFRPTLLTHHLLPRSRGRSCPFRKSTAGGSVDSSAIFPSWAHDWGRTWLSRFQASALVCPVFPAGVQYTNTGVSKRLPAQRSLF